MPAPLFAGIQPQFCDAEGSPVAAGKLYSFVAGTDTPQPTYSDVDLDIANSNPILLNAAGQSATPMYLGETGYKFRLDTPADVPLWTVDMVPGGSDVLYVAPGAVAPGAHGRTVSAVGASKDVAPTSN